MLAQLARRSLKRDASQHITYGIAQPYVCSSCLQHIRRFTASTKTDDSPVLNGARRRQVRHVGASTSLSRSLATAADSYTSSDAIPFYPPTYPSIAPRSDRGGLSDLKRWDVAGSPLLIHPQLAASVPTIRARREQQLIGGDLIELMQNLHASLVVGRWDRGANIIRRLMTMFRPSAPELLEANRTYLSALVDAVALRRADVNARKVQQWFEVEVRRRGIEPDARMLAMMCRLCFVGLEGAAKTRALRRYLHLAEQADLLHPVMTSGDFLESEWRELVEVRDDLFATPEVDTAKEKYIDEVVAISREPTHQYTIGQLEKLPEVRVAEQKGLGLATLKRTLAAVERPDSVPYPAGQNASAEATRATWLRLRQFQLENDVADAAIDRWRKEHKSMVEKGVTSASNSRSMNVHLYQWYTDLEKEVKKEMAECEKVLDSPKYSTAQERSRANYAPFLLTLKPSTVAAITINAFMDMILKSSRSADGAHEVDSKANALPIHGGPRIAHLTSSIGKSLAAESSRKQRKSLRRNRAINTAVGNYRAEVLNRLEKKSNRKTSPNNIQTTTEQVAKTVNFDQFDWPATVRVQMAAALLSKLIKLAKVNVSFAFIEGMHQEHAFKYSSYSYRGKLIGIIEVHPKLRELMAREPLAANLGARLPMLVEPAPWAGFNEGAYLLHPTRVVRMREDDGVQEMYTKAAAEKGDLEQIFAGLTALGQTGWRINRNVLKVMLEAWNTGEKFASMPPEKPNVELPPQPPEDAPYSTKYAWSRKCQEIKNEIGGYHSQRCFYNLQLEIAHKFADDVFYVPHNIDFRGRAYPIPPYLNHMGADNARGLLMFAKGKELGTEGLKWLKVHFANLAGYDKASLKEREDFAMEHKDDIIDSATNPLHGKKWWLQADDPWQCLAACIELKAAFDLPDPSKHVSHLAIHQDGTCNGLQHYAALGGDKMGAAQVNLEPGDRPSDVYTGVADLVKAEIERDAAAGNPHALALRGKITRKVVKQTVMTNVYGVTFTGARSQVLKQLDAIMPEDSKTATRNIYLATYIAKKIFISLGVMFKGAQAIQFWLADCASRISSAITREQINILRNHQASVPDSSQLYPHYNPDFITSWMKTGQAMFRGSMKGRTVKTLFKTPVIWTTPLKLPVVQPYRTGGSQVIETSIQAIKFQKSTTKDPVLKRRQVQGFPPNFIHSLDATHMLLSALKCQEMGLTFAAVHDSFWTHAADIPTMNHILRDAFIRMHSENIVDRLAAEFNARYSDALYLTSVPSKSPLGRIIKALRQDKRNDVAKSDLLKGFRTRRAIDYELLLEAERQDLLRSIDPVKRKKGEEMVTPASLYAAAKPEDLEFDDIGDEAEVGSEPKKRRSRKAKQEAAEVGIGDEAEEHLAQDAVVAEDEELVGASELTESYKAESGLGAEESGTAPAKTKRNHLEIWLPLEFPPVPEKGDWDVSRLRESTYFFS